MMKFIRESNFLPGICRIHDILFIICDVGSDTLKICAKLSAKLEVCGCRCLSCGSHCRKTGKKGSEHSIVNTGGDDLVLLTVVVER